ncbi:hypothetical protein AZI12_00245 [Levilactobacillus brevis]|nr:hypothetical protein AZI12_00245 [Levilactobacillus brevis]
MNLLQFPMKCYIEEVVHIVINPSVNELFLSTSKKETYHSGLNTAFLNAVIKNLYLLTLRYLFMMKLNI